MLRPGPYHGPRPTKASVVCASSGHKTTAHPLLSECIGSLQHRYKLGLLIRSGLLFFKRTHDRVHIDFQDAGCIADTTTVQGHVNNLLFDTDLVGSFGVVKLKATLAGFTFIALVASRTNSFSSNLVLIAAVAARNGDSYHAIQTKSPSLRHYQMIEKINIA